MSMLFANVSSEYLIGGGLLLVLGGVFFLFRCMEDEDSSCSDGQDAEEKRRIDEALRQTEEAARKKRQEDEEKRRQEGLVRQAEEIAKMRKQEAEEKRRQDEVANTFVCTKCGAIVKYPKEVGGGLGCGVWIVLILLSVVCGFFAAILWVLVAITVIAAVISFYGVRKRVCPSCGSTSTLIPIFSPEGKRLIEKSNQSEEERMEASSGTVEQRLKHLAELKGKCIISDEEYEAQRKKILDTI